MKMLRKFLLLLIFFSSPTTIGGIKVIHIENHDLNYVVFNFIFRGGSILDPEGKEGLSYITTRMLQRGTIKRTQKEIAEDIDFLGSVLEGSSSKESMYLVGDAISKNVEKFLDIVEDIIKNPTFPQEEFEKEKNLIIQWIKNLRNDDDALARTHFARFLFKGHPYGNPTSGTIKSLNNIKREDCIEFHKKYFTKENLLIGIAGDLTEKQVKEYVIKKIENLPSGGEKVQLEFPLPSKFEGLRILLIDKPERTQTQIYIGETSIEASHPDYFPLLVANTILGGTFTSKLMREIREKKGWSYGAYSFLQPERKFGSFIIRFFPASKDTIDAIKLLFSLLEDFVTNGPSDEEVEFAKDYLVNNFPFKIDTPQKKLSELISIEILEKPKNFLETYIENINRVDIETLKKVLKTHIDFKNLTMVMVCSASEFKKIFEKWESVKEMEVRPYDKDD